jgi:hypothetical protein
MAILPYLPAILGALVQLAKLLYDLAKEKSGDSIKDCAIAIDEARRTGDTSKLTTIIDQMKRGKSCE